MWRAILFLCVSSLAACSAPVAPQIAPTGEAIAFGAGAGGPRDACFTCHGLAGEGDDTIPRLAGLSTGYLVKQLEDYAGRWRDDDVMTPIAQRLPADQRLAVARYYEDLGPATSLSAGAQTRSDLYDHGDPQRDLKACVTCHDRGQSAGLATPGLAGQPASYTRAQLLAFKASQRRNDPRDVMGAIARKLTHEEIDALAAFLAAHR